MRQLARGLVTTELALLADVDLLPSSGLAGALRAEAPALLEAGRRFLVVPTLEPASEAGEAALVAAPDDSGPAFQALHAAWLRGDVRGFHAGHAPRGHGPTDFGRWLQLGGEAGAFEVAWEEGFEPYGVARVADLPAYDARFDAVFPVHDKESFFAELALGAEPFEFRVFPRGFLRSVTPAAAGAPASAHARLRPAELLLAHALARRQFQELRWAGLAPSLRKTLWPWGCDCRAHAGRAGPPFVCGAEALPEGAGSEAGAGVRLESRQRWEVPAELVLAFAQRGGGRAQLPGAGGAAFLLGLPEARHLRAEGNCLAVRLGGEGEEEPFRVRLGLPAAPWLELQLSVALSAAASRRRGRLPGLRVALPGCALQCAFKWEAGGWGGYWADAPGAGNVAHLGKRPFQLGPVPARLVQRVEVLEGGCKVLATVDGCCVFRAIVTAPAGSEGLAEGAAVSMSADLCTFLKGGGVSDPAAEARLSDIALLAG